MNKTPFLLSPAYKDYLWGGHRLKDDYCKDTDVSPLAETWECSTHPDGLSVVASGKFEGLPLRDVLKQHPEYIGTHPVMTETGDLPVLIKLIDAKKDLSVQVHPDDEYAMAHENGQRGKTELWYVLDSSPGAQLIYGFQRNVTEDEVRKRIKKGNLLTLLQQVSVHTDDIFFVKAGTVHGIGAGCLVAEIQESSNLTYRLYDYDRVDRNGEKRTLHIDKALAVADKKAAFEPRQPIRVLKFHPGYATETLDSCKYFKVDRLLLNTERIKNMAVFRTESNSFAVLLCVSGCGMMKYAEGVLPFFKGDCIFVPADLCGIRLHGKATMLKVTC